VRFLAQSPYPTILCSDLNEIGLSYSYRQLLKTGLTDAFCEAGSGWGSSFRYSRWLAPIRIDYILANSRLKPVYYQAHPSFTANEHNPIEVHYQLTSP
jgi:endonuclease/exonuclease/phosphatase family metal-dependent hydrolase